MRVKHLMLLALVSNPPSFAPLASSSIVKSLTMTGHMRAGHHKEKAPHGLALVSKPPGFAYLAIWDKNGRPPRRDFDKHASLAYWLARASSMLHIWPAIMRVKHLVLLALVSKLP
ncbi:hypothetical protein TIFTF001_034082 [Ficus carica]|uniref:Uncharacterized protein n=1 Tax=Ficus carica TaxID=3494 RepID=A0AA88J8P5_FICCA|nr:hypothetical protein TIFTF001_034082 [Ficus carica]